jgi:hypothetical protein
MRAEGAALAHCQPLRRLLAQRIVADARQEQVAQNVQLRFQVLGPHCHRPALSGAKNETRLNRE